MQCWIPCDLRLRDRVAEFGVPLFWIGSGYEPDEAQLEEELLLKLPPNIPCLGWPYAACNPDRGIGEHMGGTLASECAKFVVRSGFETVSRTVSNLSVHSGTTGAVGHPNAPLPPLEARACVSFTRSEGDGPSFYRECDRALWDDAHHGRFPMGWQQGPTPCGIMLDTLDWYHKHATPHDSFVNALTGLDHIHEENCAHLYLPERREVIWRWSMSRPSSTGSAVTMCRSRPSI